IGFPCSGRRRGAWGSCLLRRLCRGRPCSTGRGGGRWGSPFFGGAAHRRHAHFGTVAPGGGRGRGRGGGDGSWGEQRWRIEHLKARGVPKKKRRECQEP